MIDGIHLEYDGDTSPSVDLKSIIQKEHHKNYRANKHQIWRR